MGLVAEAEERVGLLGGGGGLSVGSQWLSVVYQWLSVGMCVRQRGWRLAWMLAALGVVVVGIAGAGDFVTPQAQQAIIPRALCEGHAFRASTHLAVGRGDYHTFANEHRGTYRETNVADAGCLASNFQCVEDDRDQ